MNRGARHKNIFIDDDDRRDFLRLLKDTIEMWHIEVHAFSFLSNHYHLLISTPLGNLSRAMRHIDGVFVQRFNLRHNFDGSLFRGRYKSILVEKDTYLLEVFRYIHLQSVKAGICKKPEDHIWTSHRDYIFPKYSEPWLRKDVILSLFGPGKSDNFHRLDRFVRKGVPPQVDEFYDKQRISPIFGSKEFVQRIKEKYITSNNTSYEVPAGKSLFSAVSIEMIIRIVCEEYNLPISNIYTSVRSKRNDARNIAIYLSRIIGGHLLKDIAAAFGSLSYSGVNSAFRRVKNEITTDKDFSAHIDDLKKKITITARQISNK
ncbi:MAG: helix-turn-helix domain-containing protein [Candidatus Auribacterota bacterium]|nr:helix-turn-helix domain-containing protein [Candidatus Auribacterota bacterium]